MPQIDTSTQVCAVIGNPVKHSLSPAIHNAAFQACGLNYVYVAFEAEDLAGFAAGMRAMPGFRGVSVTIPHKAALMAHLDEIDPLAERVGCINTVTREPGGRLRGSITDGMGTLRAFSEADAPLAAKRILFLGTGGAVRAVAFAMAEQAGAIKMTLLGRTPEHVETLCADLRSSTEIPIAAGDLAADIEAAMATHDVIVQGTPLGMYPHDVGKSCVPADLLRPEQVVFDMVYRPRKTQLIRDAEKAGCTVILGLEMLLHQAALQFETWTGVPAPEKAMRHALLEQIGGEPS